MMQGDRLLHIANARVRRCLVDAELPGDGEQVLVDLTIRDGRVTALQPAGQVAAESGAKIIDQDGGEVWPGLIDVHTHLDKGHIWPRAENPDGTFEAAVEAVRADRANWSADDVRRRFDFGLRCAYAHGTTAIRTHLDSPPEQSRISWAVFRELRTEWEGRITLQAASLVTLDDLRGPFSADLADLVAESGGVLGAVTAMSPTIDADLDRVFALAAERGLDLDFHVDESLDPGAHSLRHIAEASLRRRFQGSVLCGHCCSLAVQEAAAAERTLDLVRDAGIAVVSLPMCNLYLQDRVPGRTPRRRGVTLLHEMAARGQHRSRARHNSRHTK
jgi:cytosine deaminase